METLKITKENYLNYCYSAYMPRKLVKLCNIIPEFTHNPILKIVAMSQEEKCYYNSKTDFAKLFVYRSDYFYDNKYNTECKFCDTFFGFDGSKFDGVEAVEFDLASFSIKRISDRKINRFHGI